jgi:hypothetical protein
VPDDVPDYEQGFLARFHMTLEEGIAFLRLSAQWIACDPEEAKDLAHDLLAKKLLPKISQGHCEPIENPKGYLYKMLKNLHSDTCDRQNRRSSSLDEDAAAASGESEADCAALRAWFWNTVDGECFPRDCAEVIGMRLDRETCDTVRTWQEIGTRLGIMRETASRRFRNGMNIIRLMLDGDGEQRET